MTIYSRSSEQPLPEQGQVVRVRNKVWAVSGVTSIRTADRRNVHKTTLECLSDDSLGREIQVIWEREVAPISLESTVLPSPRAVDRPEVFQTFLTALRWSSSSLAEGSVIQAPFRGGVQIEEYQLAPVIRASQMPRVRLLIADDVGLGKTIEAGLVAQELIHNHRASRILVICPAHLKTKWVNEMVDKFGLEFKVIERETILQMRREFGPTINPWASFPRLVTSIDYLKTEHPRRLFEELSHRRKHEANGAKPWDLLILDEAHNVAPAGRKNYVRDSDRTSLMRAISEHFEHKLFLTATPHNGYRESFTGLLELLDSLRFSRGTELDRKQLSVVTIRRLKDDIRNTDGSRRFPPRIVMPRSPELDPALYVRLSEDERELFDLLEKYTVSRLARVDKHNERATQFVLTLLKKRALSSPMALRESLVTHATTVGVKEELDIGDSLFRVLEQREQEDWSDDQEKEEHLEATTTAASRLCKELDSTEKNWLQRMFDIANGIAGEHCIRPDSKAKAFINWILENLQQGNKWTGERVIIFTEYVHTLRYLEQLLEQQEMGEATLSIVGGMPAKDREAVHETFQASPELHSVRILLATDAASEGADFQRYCRNIVHYEIPWNPVRLEQRNGRVDRHGQRSSEVRVHHFVYENHEDSEFLKRIVEKVEAIRADIGSVGALIADNVRSHALGKKVDLEKLDLDTQRMIARKELQIDPQESNDMALLVETLNNARSALGITDQAQLDVLKRALELEGYQEALAVQEEFIFTLSKLPGTWADCRKFVSTEYKKRLLTFNRDKARDNDELIVVHLAHPLMRRALAAFRVQVWSSGEGADNALRRANVETCPELTSPVLIAWGRLVLLGPEHNRLHEGLVTVAARITNDNLVDIEDPELESLGNKKRGPFGGSLSVVAEIADKHLVQMAQLLERQGVKKAKELQKVLQARGKAAAGQARSLAMERIKTIKKTIKLWEDEITSSQLVLFDEEEQKQREQDLAALRIRLDVLQEERDKEPKRQQALYRVSDRRVYPVALEVLLPAEFK